MSRTKYNIIHNTMFLGVGYYAFKAVFDKGNGSFKKAYPV
jgi:hypothetical protein